MTKIDYRKELKFLYNPSTKDIEIIDVPAMNFLMVDGEGDPNTSQTYQEAIEALYTLSYTLKFMIKKGKEQIDYGVFPLEGLWWADDPSHFVLGNKDRWKWTAMIAQPECVTADLVLQAADQAGKKKSLGALPAVRFEAYDEGKAAQVMYTGPYADEGPTIARIHSFIEESGGEVAGRHHEVYLSDFRRTAPEKLKTIIRQPFRQKG